MRIRIQLITLVRIRIRFITLMRIRILPFNLMPIRIRNTASTSTNVNSLATEDAHDNLLFRIRTPVGG
jgi:hypothetical protein